MKFIKKFAHVSLDDVALVGGKNASLGEMISQLTALGIRVPDGFAVTADAYWMVLDHNQIRGKIVNILNRLDVHDLSSLQRYAHEIRALILGAQLPLELKEEIINAYRELSAQYGVMWCDVAVRSSATAEDLPTASFAGQQETYLGIEGEQALLEAVKKCMASLFTDRAIAYRETHNFEHMKVGLSVGVQKMVRSDLATSGVAFSLETETGFSGMVTISASYGLGEMVVKGAIIPDEFYVQKNRLMAGFRPIVQKTLGSKKEKLIYTAHADHIVLKTVEVDVADRNRFSLTDDQILEVARATVRIEEYYSQKKGSWSPMDVEWAYDGKDHQLYIVQSRPETVHANQQESRFAEFFTLTASRNDLVELTSGQSIGMQIASGIARVIKSPEDISAFNKGDIVVTAMTDPDWVPLLRTAGGIVTDQGGRTCHAAIVSRELGIPAIVGTSNATQTITNGMEITIDCSKGSIGTIYKGKLPFEVTRYETHDDVQLPALLYVNVADPHSAIDVSLLPVDGVGLARLEFIIAQMIKVHPMAIIKPEVLDAQTRAAIDELARGYASPRDYYIDVLGQAVGLIAGAFYPRPVIVRLTDFKSNEYRDLIGGSFFEPDEENPMLGFRGAIRYTDDDFKAAFELECQALLKAQCMGFDNLKVMVPFVRTVSEARKTIDALKAHGLRQEDGLELYMMVEIPSNVMLIDEFAQLFDGFSIGSNDLTQLTLGADRDSGALTEVFDERDPAVKKMMSMAISGALSAGKPIGICGQAPSDYPELATWLIKQGITSISLNPDAVFAFRDRWAKT